MLFAVNGKRTSEIFFVCEPNAGIGEPVLHKVIQNAYVFNLIYYTYVEKNILNLFINILDSVIFYKMYLRCMNNKSLLDANVVLSPNL